MSGRPRPLSSQTRSWGGDEPMVPSAESFELTSQDWPPTPPKKKAAAPPSPPKRPLLPKQQRETTFSGSVSSGRATTSGTGRAPLPVQPQRASSSSSSGKAAPGRASSQNFVPPRAMSKTPSQTSQSSSASVASIFRKPSQPSVSGSFTTTTTTTSSSTNMKKRQLPWDLMAIDQTSRASSSRSNFHSLDPNAVASGSGTASKGKLLLSDSMNIKQKVILSPEQQMVLKLAVDDGKNIFFTGSAGTGKSVLLREIITSLKRKYANRSDAVAVTASTGMAACNIGGTTIHSFAGIGLGKEQASELIKKIKKNRQAPGKWQRCQVLIIDEVSMVDAELFDKLAAIACALKKKPNRFGGIQLIVTGDFFQLPPVTQGTPKFAFEAAAWKDIDYTVNLTQVFRQKSTEFVDMLNEMRFGTMTAITIAKFRELSRPLAEDDGVEATELFPRREDVERANTSRLQAINKPESTFLAEDWPPPEPNRTNTYLANFMAPPKLVLKEGAQVMLIKNLDTTLVNGTIGRVIGFGTLDDDEDFVKDEDEAEQEARMKKKLRLAVEVNAGRAELVPIIEFRTPIGLQKIVMKREEFKVEDVTSNRKLASRRQFPLILAWAMSIHKSQGQTIPKVKVNLGKVFEKGQSYVALSRAISLEGLQVIGFDPKKVEAHERVVNWSKTLKVLA